MTPDDTNNFICQVDFAAMEKMLMEQHMRALKPAYIVHDEICFVADIKRQETVADMMVQHMRRRMLRDVNTSILACLPQHSKTLCQQCITEEFARTFPAIKMYRPNLQTFRLPHPSLRTYTMRTQLPSKPGHRAHHDIVEGAVSTTFAPDINENVLKQNGWELVRFGQFQDNEFYCRNGSIFRANGFPYDSHWIIRPQEGREPFYDGVEGNWETRPTKPSVEGCAFTWQVPSDGDIIWVNGQGRLGKAEGVFLGRYWVAACKEGWNFMKEGANTYKAVFKPAEDMLKRHGWKSVRFAPPVGGDLFVIDSVHFAVWRCPEMFDIGNRWIVEPIDGNAALRDFNGSFSMKSVPNVCANALKTLGWKLTHYGIARTGDIFCYLDKNNSVHTERWHAKYVAESVCSYWHIEPFEGLEAHEVSEGIVETRPMKPVLEGFTFRWSPAYSGAYFWRNGVIQSDGGWAGSHWLASLESGYGLAKRGEVFIAVKFPKVPSGFWLVDYRVVRGGEFYLNRKNPEVVMQAGADHWQQDGEHWVVRTLCGHKVSFTGNGWVSSPVVPENVLQQNGWAIQGHTVPNEGQYYWSPNFKKVLKCHHQGAEPFLVVAPMEGLEAFGVSVFETRPVRPVVEGVDFAWTDKADVYGSKDILYVRNPESNKFCWAATLQNGYEWAQGPGNQVYVRPVRPEVEGVDFVWRTAPEGTLVWDDVTKTLYKRGGNSCSKAWVANLKPGWVWDGKKLFQNKEHQLAAEFCIWLNTHMVGIPEGCLLSQVLYGPDSKPPLFWCLAASKAAFDAEDWEIIGRPSTNPLRLPTEDLADFGFLQKNGTWQVFAH